MAPLSHAVRRGHVMQVDFGAHVHDNGVFLRSMPSRRFHPSPYLLLTLTALFWAGNWVVGRAMRDVASPISLTFWRWILAWILLFPFALPHIRREWRTIWASKRILIILGLLGTGTYNALSYTGLQYTSVTNAVVLNSVVPILIAAVSWAFLGEKLTLVQGLGILISLTGVLCILTRADPEVLLALRFNVGDLWVFVSMLVWAFYTVALKWRPAGLHPLAFLESIATVGLVAMLPLYLAGVGGRSGIALTTGSVLALLYLGIFPALLAYIFWNRAVAEVGPSIAGLFMHLMPVFGTGLAIVFLGESLHAYHFVALALILGGLFITTHYGRGEVPTGVMADE